MKYYIHCLYVQKHRKKSHSLHSVRHYAGDPRKFKKIRKANQSLTHWENKITNEY